MRLLNSKQLHWLRHIQQYHRKYVLGADNMHDEMISDISDEGTANFLMTWEENGSVKAAANIAT
jgi:hypothetical protein